MEGHYAGALLVVGTIILVTQVVHRLGYRLLLLGGPACWVLAGLLVGPYLPSLIETAMHEPVAQPLEPAGAMTSATLGFLSMIGASLWLLRSALTAYLLGPHPPPSEGLGNRERVRTWWHEFSMVVPSAVLRFALMLWAISWFLPPERPLGPVHVFLALLLTPGSAQHAIKLDLAYLLTALQLRAGPLDRQSAPGRRADADGARTGTPGGARPGGGAASAHPGPTRRERRHVDAMAEALAQVRTGWLVLVAPFLLLVEYGLAIGQTRWDALPRHLGQLGPHLLVLLVASWAWLYARKRTSDGESLLDMPLRRLETISEDLVPFYVSVPLGLGAFGFLVVLDPGPLVHTWWFLPLAMGPVIAAVVGDSRVRQGLSGGLQSLTGLMAPIFFYVVGAEVAERMLRVPWSQVIALCAVLLVHPALAAPAVSAIDRWMGRRAASLRARARAAVQAEPPRFARHPRQWVEHRIWRLLGIAALDGRFPRARSNEQTERASRFGAAPAAYLRELLVASFSDVSLVILGLAFLGGLVSVDFAGVFVVAYVLGDLLSTLLFGGHMFSVAFEECGPHELAVVAVEDLERPVDA